ncbi:MAG: hypothetical protein QM528_04890 [Phycisphaerales bacterium]|nr:hypothetical protein [Phycisphaerales bacterium]
MSHRTAHYMTSYLIILLVGLSSLAVAQKTYLKFQGRDREFIVHVPKSYNKKSDNPIPLVICLHNNNSNDERIAYYSNLDVTANANNFFVVYPKSLESVWPNNDELKIQSEVNYLLTVIQQVRAKYHIDSTHIYCVGYEGGGCFSYLFSSLCPNKIAGLSVIDARMDENTYFRLLKVKERIPPLIAFLGTKDPFLNAVANNYVSANDGFKLWTLKMGGDTLNPTSEEVPLSGKEPCTVQKIEFTNTAHKIQTVLYQIEGGGRAWPGAKLDIDFLNSLHHGAFGYFCKSLNANQLIWDFFSSKNPSLSE